MQTSKWTVLDQTTNSGEKKFAPISGNGYRKAFLRLRKVDDFVALWPKLVLEKNIDIAEDDLTLVVKLENDTFGAGSETASNWTFDDGTTNLVISGVVKDSTTQCTITFNEELPRLAQLEGSGVSAAEENPVMTIDLTGDTFASEVAAENAANWTITVGDSGLTVASIAYVDANQCTITFTGTAVATKTVAVTAKIACLTGAAASGIMTYDIDTETSICTQNVTLSDGDITLMAEKAALITADYDSGVLSVDTATGVSVCTEAAEIFVTAAVEVDDENPQMVILLNGGEFKSPADCENLANWTVGVGDTELELTSITWTGTRGAVLNFTGTAVAGTISIACGALMDGGTLNRDYVIDAVADSDTFTPSEITGKVDVYQIVGGDEYGFVAQLTPATKTGVQIKDIPLTDEDNAFVPSCWGNFVYVPGDDEGTAFEIYGKLCIE